MRILLVIIFIIHHHPRTYSYLQYYIWGHKGKDRDHKTYCDRHHLSPRYYDYDNKKERLM